MGMRWRLPRLDPLPSATKATRGTRAERATSTSWRACSGVTWRRLAAKISPKASAPRRRAARTSSGVFKPQILTKGSLVAPKNWAVAPPGALASLRARLSGDSRAHQRLAHQYRVGAERTGARRVTLIGDATLGDEEPVGGNQRTQPPHDIGIDREGAQIAAIDADDASRPPRRPAAPRRRCAPPPAPPSPARA